MSLSEEKTEEFITLLKEKNTKRLKEFFDEIKSKPDAKIAYDILVQYHKIELDEIINQNPNDLSAREQRAQILTYQGNHASALADYNFILVREPNSMCRRNARAAVFEKLERFSEALADYQETIRIFKAEHHPSTAFNFFVGPDVIAARGIKRLTDQEDRHTADAMSRRCLV